MALARLVLDGLKGDVRFHHITPDFWIMEARRCGYRWVVFHETYSFCLLTHVDKDAPVEWKYNHRLYTADQRHAMMMQPGELHANRIESPLGDFIVVQVARDMMMRVARELGWKHSTLNINHPHPGTDHPALRRALSQFRRALCDDLYDSRPGGGSCSCWRSADRHLENLADLVAVFIEHFAEKTREIAVPETGAAVIRRATEYLYEHCHEPYSLPRLAKAAGCTDFYLAHVFRREMGIRPSEFKNKVLVAKICEKLAAFPHNPLEWVAHEVGWPGRAARTRTDTERAALVIRHFRRTLHTTPDRFRHTLKVMSPADRSRFVTPGLRVRRPGGPA